MTLAAIAATFHWSPEIVEAMDDRDAAFWLNSFNALREEGRP